MVPGTPVQPTSPLGLGDPHAPGSFSERTAERSDPVSSWMSPEEALTVPGNSWLPTTRTGIVTYHDSQQGLFYDPTTAIIPIVVAVSFIGAGVWLGIDHFLRYLLAKR
jgi:hypothetical protein